MTKSRSEKTHVIIQTAILSISLVAQGGQALAEPPKETPAPENSAAQTKRSVFSDVPRSHWSCAAVAKLMRAGFYSPFPQEFPGDGKSPVARLYFAMYLDT